MAFKSPRKTGKGNGPQPVKKGRKKMGNPKGMPFRKMGRK